MQDVQMIPLNEDDQLMNEEQDQMLLDEASNVELVNLQQLSSMNNNEAAQVVNIDLIMETAKVWTMAQQDFQERLKNHMQELNKESFFELVRESFDSIPPATFGGFIYK